MLVLNDLHIGFQRNAGTTLASREALRSYLHESFAELLAESVETHLLIAGDLFDRFEVDARDWYFVYNLLHTWAASGKVLMLMAGNHDWSPKGERMSSFEVLAKVLQMLFADRVNVIGIDQWDGNENIILLAHCSNQTVFNEKLAEILEVVKPGHRVFLHANWDNNFTVESDHSLNVSRDQGKAFAAKGATLYFAHVHQAKTDLGGSVVVLGNQWPTSIADCLGNDAKYAHVFSGSVEKLKTWSREGALTGFCDIEWTDINDALEVNGFTRIVGAATSAQASDVINAISKLRQRSSAYVVTNAVKVEGIAEAQDLPESFEAAKKFDVMEYVKKHLTPEEIVVVEQLRSSL